MAWYWWVVVAVIQAVFTYFLMTKGYFDRFVDFCSEHILMLPVYLAVIIVLLPGLGLLAMIVSVYSISRMVCSSWPR